MSLLERYKRLHEDFDRKEKGFWPWNWDCFWNDCCCALEWRLEVEVSVGDEGGERKKAVTAVEGEEERRRREKSKSEKEGKKADI